MPIWLVALITILVGAAACFYGYGIFRFLLPVLGLIYGYLIGFNLVGPDQELLAIIIGIVIGIIFAFLAYAYWSVLVTLGGVLLGFGLGALLAQALGADDVFVIVLGVVGAVVFGFLFYQFKDIMVIVSTAFSGAGSILYGLGLLIPALSFLVGQNLLAVIALVVLAVIGIAVQLQVFADRKRYFPV